MPEHYTTFDKIKVATDAFLQVLRVSSALSPSSHRRTLFSFRQKFSVCKNFASYLFETSLEVLWRFALLNIGRERTQNALVFVFVLVLNLFHSDCIISCPILSPSKCLAMNHFLRPNKWKKNRTIRYDFCSQNEFKYFKQTSEKIEMRKTNEIIFHDCFFSRLIAFVKELVYRFTASRIINDDSKKFHTHTH